jgi:alpha-glucosidase (family GH31 glycosyl hydrolase)
MFGNESEAAIVKVMRIREQLRPYVMEQYEAASADGTPIMRPLFFDFHSDAASQARCALLDRNLHARGCHVPRMFA